MILDSDNTVKQNIDPARVNKREFEGELRDLAHQLYLDLQHRRDVFERKTSTVVTRGSIYAGRGVNIYITLETVEDHMKYHSYAFLKRFSCLSKEKSIYKRLYKFIRSAVADAYHLDIGNLNSFTTYRLFELRYFVESAI